MSEVIETQLNDDIPEGFHPYVRLLIVRMRSHPEEFNPEALEPSPRTKDFMTKAESEFVWNEERKLLLDARHQQLMARIMKANEPEAEEDTRAKIVNRAMQLAQAQQGVYPNQLNLHNAQQSYLNQLGYVPPTSFVPTTNTTGTGTISGIPDPNMIDYIKRALGKI